MGLAGAADAGDQEDLEAVGQVFGDLSGFRARREAGRQLGLGLRGR
jgi:hypothetical protein